jgi:hypothetical protein
MAARNYGKIGPVAALAAAATAPLVLTLAPHEMPALGIGAALVCTLVRMTFQDGQLTRDAAKVEQQAARDVIFTSSGNRIVRISLGSVYLYAAVTCALRCLDSTVLARLLDLDASAIGLASVVWTGCVVDGYFSGLWMTSGANGE